MHLLCFVMVSLERFERPTHALEGRCSIQLSYGTSLNCGAKVCFSIEMSNFLSVFFRFMAEKRKKKE